MKLPVTDQFLWEVYNFLGKAGNIVNSFAMRRRTVYDVLPFPRSDSPVFEKYRKSKNRRQFNDLIYRLKKNSYIKIQNLQGKKAILITKKGINRAIKNRFKSENTKLNKRKDSKWIMVIFDIPQKHKKSRDLLRNILKNLGYKMFQQSVWVSPYEVSKRTEELLQWYSLDKYVKIFLIERL